jgi:hypothetical protein
VDGRSDVRATIGPKRPGFYGTSIGGSAAEVHQRFCPSPSRTWFPTFAALM